MPICGTIDSVRYRIGHLVVNSKLGVGKVLNVSGDNVTVIFKDQKDNPRTINVAMVPMTLSDDQADPWFDEQVTYKKCKKGWTAKRKRTVATPVAKKKKTVAAKRA